MKAGAFSHEHNVRVWWALSGDSLNARAAESAVCAIGYAAVKLLKLNHFG